MKERLQHPKNNFLCVGKAGKGKEIRPVLVTDPKGESEQLKKKLKSKAMFFVFTIFLKEVQKMIDYSSVFLNLNMESEKTQKYRI